jgi:GTP-binding protein EngB required for normal cell division
LSNTLSLHDALPIWRYLVIATKTDKLKSKNQQRHGVDTIGSDSPQGDTLPFSARKCRGVREIWQAILKTKTQQQ